MAIIRAEISPRDQETKDKIIAELTDVLVRYGSPRENTHVLLYEVSHDNWAKGGLSYTRRAAQAKES
ncbi:tautomerase family protein [Verrucosispora sp. WMMC514]|uniref:tautomerase family protein n=1 Tax=Verrucosispora sp. WMMC514 TaxID=3015156 RepID=UPI00248C46C0|nr:tautomerase family protein [Verrucosispora sp. WMMC514]WBB90190.1 tautomerase family protein [Verrucosispora sp. WMMC514]